MKWTILISFLMLCSCGERDEVNQLENEEEKQEQAQNEELIESVKQNPYDLDDRLIMIASKKNGGQDGSLFFDSEYETPQKYHLELPDKIQASGSPGNGQKIYILFNEVTDCMWTSETDEDYRNRVCYQNAERAPATSEGFAGGQEIELTDIESVEKVEMHVNGAQGDGILTTASAIFIKL
jgi:hypothetical protein